MKDENCSIFLHSITTKKVNEIEMTKEKLIILL